MNCSASLPKEMVGIRYNTRNTAEMNVLLENKISIIIRCSIIHLSLSNLVMFILDGTFVC